MRKGFIQKDRYPVLIKMVDGEIAEGFVFMQQDERLVDMMNDDRTFLPFETHERQIYVINKATISKIKIGYE